MENTDEDGMPMTWERRCMRIDMGFLAFKSGVEIIGEWVLFREGCWAGRGTM